jgi:hypothetical protein
VQRDVAECMMLQCASQTLMPRTISVAYTAECVHLACCCQVMQSLGCRMYISRRAWCAYAAVDHDLMSPAAASATRAPETPHSCSTTEHSFTPATLCGKASSTAHPIVKLGCLAGLQACCCFTALLYQLNGDNIVQGTHPESSDAKGVDTDGLPVL